MTVQPSLLFVFGLGYSAQQLGKRLMAAGWQVGGTVRSPEKAAALRAEGFAAEVWDGASDGAGKGARSGESLPAIPAGAHWLITVPPGEGGCPVSREVAKCPGKDAYAPASVTYLSTTGVYGDRNGAWVTERDAPAPGSERGRARVLAEQQWLAFADDRARLVRLPGIYGPGRSAFDRLRDGTARRIIKPGQVFSRVHVDDIASGLEALLQRPEQTGVFHLCDDLPAPPQDVIAHAADLLGIARPPEVAFEDAGLSPMAASFYAECKRVSNARTRAALRWRPAFPTYREGLAAILAAETGTISP